MAEKEYDFPEKGINKYVTEYIRNLPDLKGNVVLDIPCGDGRASYEFRKKGAEVLAFDLFPDFMQVEDMKAEFADLTDRLPVESDSVDFILCQEGIEHVPNQLQVLQEFNRVLKKGGQLLITTPNNSQIRARVATCLFETDLWKRFPPTELDSIWFAENNTDKLYFGHLFLLGVQHLQSLMTFSGFKVKKRIKTDWGTTSLILGVLMYPLMAVTTLFTYFAYKNKNTHVEEKARKEILAERMKLNLSPVTLFRKHIFWVVEKTGTKTETIEKLKAMHRTEEQA